MRAAIASALRGADTAAVVDWAERAPNRLGRALALVMVADAVRSPLTFVHDEWCTYRYP